MCVGALPTHSLYYVCGSSASTQSMLRVWVLCPHTVCLHTVYVMCVGALLHTVYVMCGFSAAHSLCYMCGCSVAHSLYYVCVSSACTQSMLCVWVLCPHTVCFMCVGALPHTVCVMCGCSTHTQSMLCEWVLCLHIVYVPCACLRSMEAIRGQEIPRNWTYRRLCATYHTDVWYWT